MNNKLFREKSIERVSSPEQLNDYIRVANPGIWLVLLGVIFILVGVCVWGIFGRLDTLLTVGAATKDGQTVCYVKEADVSRIAAGMPVRAGNSQSEIEEISLRPVHVDEGFPEYLCHIGGIAFGEWVYEISLKDRLGEDGSIFSVDIVIESVAPMRFVIN